MACFTYHADGNLDTSNGYATGADNLLLSDGIYTYTYDKNENRTSRTCIATGVVTYYSYDYENRLTQEVEGVWQSGQFVPTWRFQYAYDFAGNQIASYEYSNGQWQPAVYTVYDGSNPYLQVTDADDLIGSGNNTSAYVSQRYVYGPAVDEILANETFTPTTSTVFYACSNKDGTPQDVVTVGGVDTHVKFDDFGNALATMVAGFNYGMDGMRLNSLTSEYTTASRILDSLTNRFLTPDPADQGTNLSVACNNNWTIYADPSGLSWFTGYGNGASGYSPAMSIALSQSPELAAAASASNWSTMTQTQKYNYLSTGSSSGATGYANAGDHLLVINAVERHRITVGSGTSQRGKPLVRQLRRYGVLSPSELSAADSPGVDFSLPSSGFDTGALALATPVQTSARGAYSDVTGTMVVPVKVIVASGVGTTMTTNRDVLNRFYDVNKIYADSGVRFVPDSITFNTKDQNEPILGRNYMGEINTGATLVPPNPATGEAASPPFQWAVANGKSRVVVFTAGVGPSGPGVTVMPAHVSYVTATADVNILAHELGHQVGLADSWGLGNLMSQGYLIGNSQLGRLTQEQMNTVGQTVWGEIQANQKKKN